MLEKNHYQKYIIQSKKEFRRVARLQESEALRIPISDGPTLENRIVLPRRFLQIFCLLIYRWELDPQIAWELQLDLEDKDFLHYSYEQRKLIKVLLSLMTSEEILTFLLKEEFFTLNEVFGFLSNKSLRFKIRRTRPRKVRKGVYRRGYRDKGTLSPSDHKVDAASDVLFQERAIILNNHLLLQKKLISNYAQFISLRTKLDIVGKYLSTEDS